MELHIHKCEKPNIGDDINSWVWQSLLGKTFIERSGYLVGIGTVINNKLPAKNNMHIFGSGYGYDINDSYQLPPDANVHFVRGPLSARALGLSENKAISDPGILISDLIPLEKNIIYSVSFMPHIGIDSENYRALVESIGINYISPSDEPDTIFKSICQSKLLITSAMHGAIFADSYRTPWLPVITDPGILPFKWEDWTSSLKLSYSPTTLPTLWGTRDTIFGKVKWNIKAHKIKSTLKLLASRSGNLSDEKTLNEKKKAMYRVFENFKKGF